MQKAIIKHPYIMTNKKISRGSPVIAGTRTRILDIIIEYEYLGYAPDEIVSAHPHLTLSQVHDALSFYYENREEIDREIKERIVRIDELQEKLKSAEG